MIKILNIKLLNFKGIRDLFIEFNEKETSISGENGTGKTTVADAFIWLLFGKDSSYRTNFNLKTLDEDGKEILHLNHSVESDLDVDGKTVKLGRSLAENWSKIKGEPEPIFKGNTTDYYINDVRVTKKDFDTMVNSMIPEQEFKMVTSPSYFPSLSPDQQKDMLFKMAGNVTDEDAARGNKEFMALIETITDSTLEVYKKEISQKKRRCSDELKGIPGRIEENKNKLPEKKDWANIESEVKEISDQISFIESQITDRSKSVAEAYKGKEILQGQLSTLTIQRNSIVNKAKENTNNKNNDLNTKINDIQYKVDAIDRDIENRKKTIEELNGRLAPIPEQLKTLRLEYAAIFSEKLEYKENEFICPVCQRSFDAEDIEAKKAEMLQNFNTDKANRIKDNQASGKSLNVQYEELKTKMSDEEKIVKSKQTERATLVEKISNLSSQAEYRNAEDIAKEDPEYIRITNEITQIENQLKVEIKPVDVSDLATKKGELSAKLDELKKELFQRTIYDNTIKRIDELEESQSIQAQELAKLEKIEFTIQEFEKAKDSLLEEKINDMFQLVKFKFVKEQINSGNKIICECTVDGVPYSNLNTAMKVNAGLDIINAICKRYKIGAPIFIDNRESVNSLIDMESQIINLVVSKDKQLTIN